MTPGRDNQVVSGSPPSSPSPKASPSTASAAGGGGSPWTALLLGVLLLPTTLFWLDAARAVSGRRYAHRAPDRRVVVLGFDGVDPEILKEYLPRLPALADLARTGAFQPCRTTDPPESPVAWATFATGDNPGGHGIFDFVRRDPDAPDGYRPRNGMIEPRPPLVTRWGLPLRPPGARNRRDGAGFWEPVAEAGFRVSVLRMPLTFPAREPRGGELLCGLGVPDLRATQGSYTLFAAGRDAWEGWTEFGGRHLVIYPRDGAAASVLEGPLDPRAPESGRRLAVPVRFSFPAGGGGATVAVGQDDDAERVALAPDRFSRWVHVEFRAGPLVRVRGLVRFRLLRGGATPAVYASPIQIAPKEPPAPLSAPRGFAARLTERLGPMRTAGWPQDTFAANDGVLDDVALFEDIRDAYDANERLLLDRLDHAGAALTVMVFTAQDRASHMYFRYRDDQHPAHDPQAVERFRRTTGVRDPILETYRWMDRTVAAVRRRLGPDDVLLLVSDHGFHTWRYGMNLNTWLLENGYLALHDRASGARRRNLDEFFRRRSGTGHVDWSRTRAYALGLGQIYVNLKGREPEGTVEPADRAALLAGLRAKLEKVRGPDGAAVFAAVRAGEDLWQGPHMDEAPDLQCAFAGGYRVSWQTALLGVPDGVFEVNAYPWSGDHCSNDAAQTAGVFLANVPLGPLQRPPGLEQVAPTVCRLFGVDPPPRATAPPLPLQLEEGP